MKKRDLSDDRPGNHHVKMMIPKESIPIGIHVLAVAFLPTYILRELQDPFIPKLLSTILKDKELTQMSAFCFTKIP